MRTFLIQHKISVILCAILVAGSYFYFQRVQEASTLTQQAAVLQTEISNMPEPDVLFREKRKGVTFSWIQSVPDFLRELNKWARKRSIGIVSIEPKEPTLKEGYIEQPIKLEVQGRFRAIGDYLSFLEGLPRPLQVTGLKLTSPEELAPDLKAKFELVLYIKDAA